MSAWKLISPDTLEFSYKGDVWTTIEGADAVQRTLQLIQAEGTSGECDVIRSPQEQEDLAREQAERLAHCAQCGRKLGRQCYMWEGAYICGRCYKTKDSFVNRIQHITS